MHTERQDWFGSTIGLGGRRKFDRARGEGWEGVGEKPHFSQSTREMGHPGTRRKDPLLAKDARNGAPRTRRKGPTSRKVREKWGTLAPGGKTHFSQRTREMGHPGEKPHFS